MGFLRDYNAPSALCCPTLRHRIRAPGACPRAAQRDPPARKVNCSSNVPASSTFSAHWSLNIESSFYQLLKSLLLPREEKVLPQGHLSC